MGNDPDRTFEEAMAHLGLEEDLPGRQEAEDRLFEEAVAGLGSTETPSSQAKRSTVAPISPTVQSLKGLRRLVKTGYLEPAATLDLHRMTRRQALPAIRGFLIHSRDQGHRLVAIICGQGLHSRGAAVLPEALDQWLQDDLAHHVILAMAAPRDGGGQGARYVLLRPG